MFALVCILNSKKHPILWFSTLPYPDSVMSMIGMTKMNIFKFSKILSNTQERESLRRQTGVSTHRLLFGARGHNIERLADLIYEMMLEWEEEEFVKGS